MRDVTRIPKIDRLEFNASESDRRKRLEDMLFERFPGLSRMYLREVVRNGDCEVNGRQENVGYKLRPGDFVEVRLDLGRENSMRPEPMSLKIIFEDEQLLILDKQTGVLVHPTHRDKNGTLLNGVVYHLNAGRNGVPAVRPGLVHRLDKNTSGLVTVAKDTRTHRILARAFQKRQVLKRYVALVSGRMADDEGMIDAPIGRFADRKLWDVKDDGKHSTSRYHVLKRVANKTLIELEPVTGRTNQLRIHCAHIGHPIVGDIERGGLEYRRLCLHASRLGFRHPGSGEPLEFSSEPDFTGAVATDEIY
jgi:23S rRNA pseudouridine1911/1915/1917 synthase